MLFLTGAAPKPSIMKRTCVGLLNEFCSDFLVRAITSSTNIIRSIQTSFYKGGLIGLCLGFSFISGIEILFWLCCCCHEVKKKCLEENIEESPENPAKASIYQIKPELVSSSVQTESAMVQDNNNNWEWSLACTIPASSWPGRQSGAAFEPNDVILTNLMTSYWLDHTPWDICNCSQAQAVWYLFVNWHCLQASSYFTM